MSKIAEPPSNAMPVLPPVFSLIRGRVIPILYAGSSVATATAQLVAGFLVIRWITPEELGLWQSVRMAQIYSFILLAGINNGLGRELPFYLGKGDEDFARRLAGTSLCCVTLANGVVLFCGLLCAIIFGHTGAHLVCAILAVTLLIVLGFYQNVLTATFRANDSFKKLTQIQLIEAGLSISTVPLVYFFGYNGMLGRAVFIAVVVGLMTYASRPMRVKLSMDAAALKLLLKTGLPIFGLDYLRSSCSTLDRIILLRIGGIKDVGFYSLAGVTLQTLTALPTSLSSYVYPRMTYKFGQNGNKKALWGFGLKFTILALAFTTLAAITGWIILPYFVPAFIPKYLRGLHAAQIALFTGIFGAFSLIVNALWSIKAWKLMVSYQILSAATYALGPILGVIFIGKSLEGVAWGVVIGAALRGTVGLILTYYGTHRTGEEQLPINIAL